MFKKKYKYSKYICSFDVKHKLFNKVYTNLIGTFKLSIQYHFERDIFGNEVMIIYTDRPGLIIGKAGKNIDELTDIYKSINPKCKNIDVYETNFLNVN